VSAKELMKLRKATFSHVESEIRAYKDTVKEIDKLKRDILYSSPSGDDENVGGGRSSFHSDITSMKATLMLGHRKIVQLETIVNAIEYVLEKLPEDKQRLVELYYWKKPQTLTWDGIAERLHVGKRTAQYWRDEIVYAVAERIGWR
jgi:RinA family phage transcriptional activator